MTTRFDVTRPPDSVVLVAGDRTRTMAASSETEWTDGDVTVRCSPSGGALAVTLAAAQSPVIRLRLNWRQNAVAGARYLGDHWERGYGDLEWRGMVPERVMPWYFLAHAAGRTYGCGVKTGANSLCSWTVDDCGISLWIDVRSGGSPVKLGDRVLHAADVVAMAGNEGESAYAFACRFCAVMCPAPLLPAEPVYGGNNWYYAYGNSSHAEILADSKLVAGLAPATGPRPFMVIDDGWQTAGYCCGGGPWEKGNEKFPDMPGLAAQMKAIGVRPGIWARPTLTHADLPKELVLYQFDNEAQGAKVLDPTHPDALAIVKEDCRRIASWGYELLKFDFSTYDILRRWGFAMGSSITPDGWTFHDPSKTTAEAILGLYRTIREGSGDMLLIGCNTIGHLAAGIVEIQRTGDDTSGRQWERTRKMGVNTLAFRMPQHNTFFAADADCVGITRDLPWDLNKRWLDLLAASGTPLFVSAAPDAVTPEIQAALRKAFAIASKPQPAAEPLDWMETTCPRTWRFGYTERSFTWSDSKCGDLST